MFCSTVAAMVGDLMCNFWEGVNKNCFPSFTISGHNTGILGESGVGCVFVELFIAKDQLCLIRLNLEENVCEKYSETTTCP